MLQNELQKGLLNWYPFKEGAVALCIGKAEELFKKELQLHNIQVISELEAMEKSVDYIIVMGVLESSDKPSERLKECKSYLKPDGHLFLAVENRMGLRYFAGDRDPYTDRVFDSIEGYRNLSDNDKKYVKGRNFAKYEIEDFLAAAGLHGKFYSILPGLEMPQQIYAEDYLPTEELESRFTPLYHQPGTVFLDEGRLYTGLIANGMFHQMANAYLVDCTFDKQESLVDFVTTSMDRGMEKATATILYRDGIVEKKALYPQGSSAIDTLVKNTEALASKGIKVVPISSDVAGSCQMPYVKAPSALVYLRELIYADKDTFIEEVDRFVQLIYKSSGESNKPAGELGKYYADAYVDMVPLNCFWIDGEFVFYDQEYVEHDYPINVVVMRALDIIYMNDKSMEAIIPESFFFEKYGMAEKANALRTMGSKYIQELRSQDALSAFNAMYRADGTLVNSNRLRLGYTQKEHKALFSDILPEEGQKLYLFGAGQWACKFIAEYGDRCEIVGALDNNSANWGNSVDGIEIMNPAVLQTLEPESYKVVICIKYYASILLQLRSYGAQHISIYDPYQEPEESVASKQVVLKPIEVASSEQKDSTPKKYHIGYNAGVFDLFHIGHLNILKRAKEQCDYLVVGVVSDEQASKGKNKSPYINEQERLEIVKACRYVDEAFILHPAASGTRDVYKKYHFDAQFSGSDYEHDPYWLGEQKWLRERGADLVFFPYTQSTSSTKLKDAMEKK